MIGTFRKVISLRYASGAHYADSLYNLSSGTEMPVACTLEITCSVE